MILRPKSLRERMILPDERLRGRGRDRELLLPGQDFMLNTGYAAGVAPGDYIVLLHCDGTNGSTTIVNSGTGPTFSVQTAGSLSTTGPLFGTACYDSTGTNGFLKGASSITLDGKFTIAVSLDPDNFNGCLCAIGSPNNDNNALALNRFNDAFYVQKRIGGTTSTIVEANVTWNQSGYNHACLERDANGLISQYFNGVLIDTVTDTTSFIGIPAFGDYAAGGVWNMKGKYDELLIVKGGMHFGAAFSVPVAPYTIP